MICELESFSREFPSRSCLQVLLELEGLPLIRKPHIRFHLPRHKLRRMRTPPRIVISQPLPQILGNPKIPLPRLDQTSQDIDVLQPSTPWVPVYPRLQQDPSLLLFDPLPCPVALKKRFDLTLSSLFSPLLMNRL